VQRFLDGRYVSASEACWRIFNFRLQERSPNVERLPIHLPDGQQVFYDDDDTDERKELLLELSKRYVCSHVFRIMCLCLIRSKLNEYFKLEQRERIDSNLDYGDLPAARDLLYKNIQKYYTWQTSKCWQRRRAPKKSNCVGRMFSVHPREGERYYLRLLMNFRKDIASFDELKRVDDKVSNQLIDLKLKLQSFRTALHSMKLALN